MIKELIKDLEVFYKDEYSGHDLAHTLRVTRLASTIAKEEEANLEIVELAALLHDVDDFKLTGTYSNEHAIDFMNKYNVSSGVQDEVIDIINHISFKGSDTKVPESLEGQIVQDADRLDAIGAIGIARALTFGGNKNRVLYDPSIKPLLDMDEKTYRKHNGTTINHFYEKLLLLKDMMNTESAKRIAEARHSYMEEFLDEFKAEWDGER